MPSETVGKNRKLARPYHGPYRVVHITPSNAEVRLIEHPTEPSIFVAIERLRKCYPEQTNDCWLGTKKRIPKKRNAKQFTPGSTVDRTGEPPRRGPVTRSLRKQVSWNPDDEVIS